MSIARQYGLIKPDVPSVTQPDLKPKRGRRFEAKATAWFVYGLVDPRSGDVFYVGCSYNVEKRIKDHTNDSGSSAWLRMNEIKDAGLEATLKVFKTFPTKIDGLAYEKELILSMPNLVNLEKIQADLQRQRRDAIAAMPSGPRPPKVSSADIRAKRRDLRAYQ